MRIINSQLSMDASVGHMDVTEMSGSAMAMKNSFSSAEDEQFTLKLPSSVSASQRYGEQSFVKSSMIARSQVNFNDGSVQHLQTEQEFVEKMISGLTEKQTRVSNVRLLDERDDGEGVISSPRASRRYYRIGGESFSVSFSASVTHQEYSQLNMQSSGAIKTADGRSIDFTLQMSMENYYFRREQVSLGASNLIDPLILNFSGGIDTLAEESRFAFDLNCDGKLDNFCGLKKGVGILALDLNKDNQINDGGELFGPMSGNGYSELGKYDADDNGWIDENDPIFESLLVWMQPQRGGEQELVSLKDAGVGAIALNNVKTGFDMKDNRGQMMGHLKAASVFLTEGGEVRTLQELDLAALQPEGKKKVNRIAGRSGRSEFMWYLENQLAHHKQRMSEYLHDKERLEEKDTATLEKKFWQWQEDEKKLT